MDWKAFANWFKIAIAIEMAVMFILVDRAVMDIILICVAQYALFLPVDASLLIKNIRGAVEASAVVPEAPKKEKKA